MGNSETGGGAPSSALLDLLSDEEWALLRSHMEERSYQPGDLVLARGTLDPDFQVVAHGAASVSSLDLHGERVELTRLGPGDCIGEMALLTGEPASADIHAITSVVTQAIAPSRLAALGPERARLIEALSVILAERLRRANERLLETHEAKMYVVDAPALDPAALAPLPGEMARCAGERLLVIVEAGERYHQPGFLDAATADAMVSVEVVDEESAAESRSRLHRQAHSYDRIVVFADGELPREIAQDTDVVVRFAPAHEPTASESGIVADERLVLIDDLPWTHANVRRLSKEAGRRVTGVLAARPAPPALAKLARVLTGRQIGLALGAGAAKGFAHIGVLRALEELCVPIDVVSGSSIGAAIGAGYASGLGPDALAANVTQIASKARRFTVPLHSFLSSNGIRDELRRVAGNRTFEDLDLPLALVATDLLRRSEVTFTSGVVWPAILASMAIPGIYPPLRARGSYLVDGGVLSPVPARQARELGAGVVVGVRLTGKAGATDGPHPAMGRPLATETIMRSLEIMNNRLSEISNDQADVTIGVALEGGGIGDFSRGEQYMKEGHRAALAAAGELRAALPVTRGAA